MARVELIEIKVARIIELLEENKREFAWSPVDILGLNPNVAIHLLDLDPNTKKKV